MSFQGSARKWRPQIFEELVGQDAIVQTLTNAIEMDRVSHAYLFSGTRGVGKTTTARIFAKALNCEQGPTPKPCGQCEFCQEIRDGRCVDVMEIDGASNTGVGEVRDIIDNVRYATSACMFKVYIIDEVHMLSKSAFNALLKTLEEPPEKVVFIFATTESHKIPETILSRCQCFEFKPLSHHQIVQQLETICQQEEIDMDPRGMETIAKTGAGSMRDAQSLLDQVLAFAGKKVESAAVESVLGIVGRGALESFVDALIAKDPEALIVQIQSLADEGKDLNFFCRDLIEYLRNLLVASFAKEAEKLVNTHSFDLETLKKQAGQFHRDELHQLFKVFSQAELEMKRSSFPHMTFEMATLRATEVRPFQEIDALLEKVNTLETGLPSPSPAREPSPVKKKAESTLASAPSNAEGTHSVTSTVIEKPGGEFSWEHVKTVLGREKNKFHHYLGNSRLLKLEQNAITLGFPDQFTLDLVDKPENLEFIRNGVKTLYGLDVQINVKLLKGNAEEENPDNNPGFEPTKQAPADSRGGSEAPVSRSESEIIQDALDIFGGMLLR